MAVKSLKRDIWRWRFHVAGGADAGDAAAEQLLMSPRELFAALNPPFEQQAKDDGGDKLTIKQSHAGSSKQALAILQGPEGGRGHLQPGDGRADPA